MILILLDLRQNNCRRRNVHVLRFDTFAFVFLLFSSFFLADWGFTELLMLGLWGLEFLKTFMNFFIEGTINGETELTMRRFSFWLVEGRFLFEGFLVLWDGVKRTEIVLGLVCIDFFLLNHWISNLTLFIIQFEFRLKTYFILLTLVHLSFWILWTY